MGAFALLGWLIGTSVFLPTEHRIELATAADVASRLDAWTRTSSNVPLHTQLAVTPDSGVVEWLSALRHSGHLVTWSGTPPAVAMSVEALPDPHGGARIDLSAPSDTRVEVRDEAGVIDSVSVKRLGARITSPSTVGAVTANAGAQRFGAAVTDASPIRNVVVIGAASWEGKFIASALEERGWPVTVRFSVAPNVDVTQGGASLVLDTSRVSAVIAVDTSIARYAGAIARFVRSGGGLVLAGPASLAPSVSSLAPGSLGNRVRPAVEPKDTISLGATGFYPVSSLRQDGIAIERRADGIAIAARRVGAGRVVQVGYDDSWRWRMAGGAGSVAAHREWWSRVVGSVAYRSAAPELATSDVERSAPLAWMVQQLGSARTGPPSNGPRGPLDRRIFITLIMILLLSEWASRRLRGLR
ncbi:MAG TPA: hypothetical protein VGM67_09610 [Gemmatimonadaceae bacterium]